MPRLPPKYHNTATEVEGILFASKAEATRYKELCLLVKAGAIRDLTRQLNWPLKVNGKLICNYKSDFQYFDHDKGQWVVEDVKGMATPVYKIKAKLMKALYGIDIVEIRRVDRRKRSR